MNMKIKIKTIAFRTLGCRLNRSESDSISNDMLSLGYDIVDEKSPADLVFINSCAVTAQAEAKTRAAISSLKKISPNGKIVLAGCYSQELKEELLKLDVQMVLGNLEKFKLAEYIDELENGEVKSDVSEINEIEVIDREDYYTFNKTSTSSGTRTRAFMKIQDGCDYFCSYCIIPYLRGRTRSRSIEDCVKEAIKLGEDGYKEIVLSGINVGTYKAEKGENLTELLKVLLRETSIERFRLSSIEPNLIDDGLIELMAKEQRICSYFHIPLQYGSNRILKEMNRKYTIAEFESVLAKIKSNIPNIGVGTDIIVGYPGEENKDFEDMLSFLKKTDLMYFHIFRYSERGGTVASKLHDNVNPAVKKERSSVLRNLSDEKKQGFINRMIGKKFSVLFEDITNKGYLNGYTDNYFNINVKAEKDLINTISMVKIIKAEKGFVEGVIVE